MPKQVPDQTLDDVQVLGAWNFTLQGDTPLYWLRTGQLDRYLLKLRIHSPCPSTAGLILHAEVDGPGSDGVSFWVERRAGREGREATRRYMLAGEGLESKPIVTRTFPDEGGEFAEDVEVLMEGYSGTIFLQDRKVLLRFRTKQGKGALAFYNSTQAEKDDVHFSSVRITALRRGPLEVGGTLLKRERTLARFAAEGSLGEEAEASTRGSAKATPKASTGGFGAFGGGDSRTSTVAPDSLAPRMSSTMTLGSGGFSGFGGAAASQASAARLRQQLPSPSGAGGRSPMQLAGRRPTSQGRLQLSASEGALRKTAGSLLAPGGGSSGASSPAALRARQPGRRGGGGDGWLPLATNAPAGEQQLLMGIKRRGAPAARACTDFIAM